MCRRPHIPQLVLYMPEFSSCPCAAEERSASVCMPVTERRRRQQRTERFAFPPRVTPAYKHGGARQADASWGDYLQITDTSRTPGALRVTSPRMRTGGGAFATSLASRSGTSRRCERLCMRDARLYAWDKQRGIFVAVHPRAMRLELQCDSKAEMSVGRSDDDTLVMIACQLLQKRRTI